MNSYDLKLAIETLRGQNENGRFAEVINQMEVQFQDLQKVEREKYLEEKWGLTKVQYDEVMNEYKATINPIEDAFMFNNKQMRLFAHLFAGTSLCVTDQEGSIITFDDARERVIQDPFDYIDVDDVVEREFGEVDEDELYEKLVEMRDDEYDTDEEGNVVNEEDRIISN